MIIAYWKKNKNKIDAWDMGLIKLTMVIFTLFVITIWSAAMDWVHSVNTWYFLIAAVIIGARPFYRYYIK